MRWRWLAVILLIFGSLLHAQKKDNARPIITGISHLALYESDMEAAKTFYGHTLGLPLISAADESPRYCVNPLQSLELEPTPSPAPRNRVAHLAFSVKDAEEVRSYLGTHGIQVPDKVLPGRGGVHWFAMNDPDGNPIEFVEDPPHPAPCDNSGAVSRKLIHAGFLVTDRAAEDHFYKELLGFKLYWHGGMKNDVTDWVDMQVPDGSQWLEYMLNVSPDSSQRVLGIFNHLALGVPDIHAAADKLKQNGWKETDDEKPQIGRDGKWQLNLYDPEATRVELMEFRPVEKPCCAAYTGKHPQ